MPGMVGNFLMAEESVCKITAMQVKRQLRVETGVKAVPSLCPSIKTCKPNGQPFSLHIWLFSPTLEFLCVLAWVRRKHG